MITPERLDSEGGRRLPQNQNRLSKTKTLQVSGLASGAGGSGLKVPLPKCPLGSFLVLIGFAIPFSTGYLGRAYFYWL